MLQGLVRETAEKAARLADADFEELLLSNPSQLYDVEGLEVETLPAVMVNGEQITAGTLISTKQLLLLLNAETQEE
jgi:hypothetical protein